MNTAQNTILVLDDEVSHRMLTSRAVRKALPTAKIVEAQNTRDARLILEANAVSLAIFDLNLGGESSLGLLNWIREFSNISSLPVLVISTSDLETDFIPAYKAGADAFVVKHPSPEQYSAFIQGAVKFLLAYNLH